ASPHLAGGLAAPGDALPKYDNKIAHRDVLPLESCATLALLRCGVKRKTPGSGDCGLQTSKWRGFYPPQDLQSPYPGRPRSRMGTLPRSDGWPPIKLAALVAALAPAAWLAAEALAGGLGARALKQAVNLTGDWSIYFLLATLAVTPARHILAAPRLVLVRRTLGVAAFGYAALHVVLYALDLDLDLGRVAREIVLRAYLTIGAV